jgi:hypothetical protein
MGDITEWPSTDINRGWCSVADETPSDSDCPASAQCRPSLSIAYDTEKPKP